MMTLKEALHDCPPGYYVKYIDSGWNDNRVQFGRDRGGELFWTAGMSVSGALTENHRITKGRMDESGYGIYRVFGDDRSLLAYCAEVK